jgi:hypothetical protein
MGWHGMGWHGISMGWHGTAWDGITPPQARTPQTRALLRSPTKPNTSPTVFTRAITRQLSSDTQRRAVINKSSHTTDLARCNTRVTRVAQRSTPSASDSDADGLEPGMEPSTSAAALFDDSHIASVSPAVALYLLPGLVLAAFRSLLWVAGIALDLSWFRNPDRWLLLARVPLTHAWQRA